MRFSRGPERFHRTPRPAARRAHRRGAARPRRHRRRTGRARGRRRDRPRARHGESRFGRWPTPRLRPRRGVARALDPAGMGRHRRRAWRRSSSVMRAEQIFLSRATDDPAPARADLRPLPGARHAALGRPADARRGRPRPLDHAGHRHQRRRPARGGRPVPARVAPDRCPRHARRDHGQGPQAVRPRRRRRSTPSCSARSGCPRTSSTQLVRLIGKIRAAEATRSTSRRPQRSGRLSGGGRGRARRRCCAGSATCRRRSSSRTCAGRGRTSSRSTRRG